ncbi:amino acid ABC transporter substrate-binding protein [Aidingimonas halophila]|uniref:Amino acid ABC transporter substrate-binding protein, PAAT family n=1 Tax=Aidingimonas halophila TaxID=574349 RepID=A0A1H2WT80_9GAMM|nr:amino acid ABC transporter substrate-binding protein [Aidingimonas halophila]GHC27558.1 amino acid ABC transporter substrate-binding protein [Aidingimonas halophila]SDW83842.1 amino acid ABC transporter substrate-binding protein, PAAT family [Aidingimonas halophila]
MLRRFTLAALATGLMTLGGLVHAEDDTIKVGMSGGYFPFTFVEQDTLKGFEVDVMEAVADELDREVEFVTADFSGLFGMLESGRIDTIANQITITEERQAKYLFTDPYVYDGAQVVVKEGNAEIEGVEDLRDKSVAVNLGSNYEDLLRELPYADEIDIRTYDSNIEQDTALGRVDAFVMDRVSATQVIKEKPLPLQLAGPTFSEIRNALPFRDTETDRKLRDQVNEALDALREDGTLTEISERWFDADITTQP